MVSKILGIKTPDNSAAVKAQQDQAATIAKQADQVAADKKNLQTQQTATLNASRARRAGYRSLLSGLETGSDSAGNTGAQQLRTDLG